MVTLSRMRSIFFMEDSQRDVFRRRRRNIPEMVPAIYMP